MNKILIVFATTLLFSTPYKIFADNNSNENCTSDTVLWVNNVNYQLPCGYIQGSLPTIINPDLQKNFMNKLDAVMTKQGLFPAFGKDSLCDADTSDLCSKVDLAKNQKLTIDLDTSILQASSNFVSIRVDVPFFFLPSAHPSTAGLFFNFNPKTGKAVDGLEGLSKKQQDNLIEQVVKVLERRGIDGTAASAEGNTLKDKVKGLLSGHVGFTSTEAIFVFWRYEIAPGSAGNQVVHIPFNRFVNTND
jgi:hypothetical protein